MYTKLRTLLYEEKKKEELNFIGGTSIYLEFSCHQNHIPIGGEEVVYNDAFYICTLAQLEKCPENLFDNFIEICSNNLLTLSLVCLLLERVPIFQDDKYKKLIYMIKQYMKDNNYISLYCFGDKETINFMPVDFFDVRRITPKMLMDTEIDWYNITEGYDINVILNIFSFFKDVQGVVHIASHLIAQLNNEYKVLVKHAKQSEADRLLSVIRFLDIVRRLSDENMQRALDDANAKVDSLAAELASFQIKYSKLKENNSKLEIWYNSLKSQCAQLENELYNLNHIKSEQKELRRVIFQLNQEIDNARKKYESCNNAWSNKYYTVEKECEKWKREYEEMKEECKVAGKCFTKSQAAIFLKAIGFLEEKLHDNDSWKVPDNKTVGKIANNIFGYSAEKSRQSLSQTNAADVTVIKNALKNKYPILEKCLK